MRYALVLAVLYAAAAHAADDVPKASGSREGKRVVFPAKGIADGAKVTLAILESCTDESLFDAGEFKKAEHGDHLRLVFTKPVPTTVRGGKIEVSELVLSQPLNTGVFWVRAGDQWRRYAKYTYDKEREAAFESWLREARPAD